MIIQLCNMCNRENEEGHCNVFIYSFHNNVFTVMSSSFWQSENEDTVILFREKILTP